MTIRWTGAARALIATVLALGTLVLGAGAAGAGQLPEDTTPPTCSAQITAGPPTVATFTIQDSFSGLESIVVNQSQNADTVVPPFTVGTSEPVVVTSTRIDQTQPFFVELTLTDVSENVFDCHLAYPNPALVFTVELTAEPTSVAFPGGEVAFRVVLTNTGDEPFIITGIEDDVFGDVSDNFQCIDAVGAILDPDDVYECAYSGEVTGPAGTQVPHTVTVEVEDLTVLPASATGSDEASVAIQAPATTTSTTTTTTLATTSTAGATTTTARVGAGALSRTGSDTGPLVSVAGALLALGGTALLLGYRRRSTS